MSSAGPLPPHVVSALERRHKQNNTFLMLIAMVLVVGLIALGNWFQWWTIGGRRADAAPAPCPVQKVVSPDLIRVNVLNGTDRHGLAAAVAKELRRREFRILSVATERQQKPLKVVALIRYGPLGAREAHTIALQFPKGVKGEKDDRDSRSIDIVLGEKYTQMAERKKAAAAIAPAPEPEGCVRATPTPSS